MNASCSIPSRISMPNSVDEVVETVDTFISSRDVVPCLGVTVANHILGGGERSNDHIP